MTRVAVAIAACAALLAAASGTAAAQTSADFHLTQYAIDSGSVPPPGASSAHDRIRLDALGDAVASSRTMTSATQRMDGGLVAEFPPPGEVQGLLFRADRKTLAWRPEPSIGAYEVYRDLLNRLPGSYGTCAASGLGTASWTDAAVPPARNGYFYLVTARNRMNEEGPRGYNTAGVIDPATGACP